MQKNYILFLFLFISVSAFSQATLRVSAVDKETREPLIGATVLVGEKGFSTDLEGNIVAELAPQSCKLMVSYVGYETFEQEIELKEGENVWVVELQGQTFQEVVLIADIAMDRKTPISFSNISTKQIAEELSAQDLPMILNATPGVYATQSGGGDGDARINIRGFNQRNIAVMVDGIPVNDMENGWVYWSNWFGLDLVTQTMQVQRGLGASKLALPSVGGTVNILTKGIDAKRGLRFKQEIGNDGYLRSTIGMTSGRLDNGWGISAAASYKEGDGWVNGTFTKGYFYYLRIDKKIDKHLFTLSGFGAPQEHGQRPFRNEISIFSKETATSLGITESQQIAVDSANRSVAEEGVFFTDQGIRFNSHIGILDGEQINTRQNFYHKPQFNLRHSWIANKRFELSNVAYLSIGKGGGVGPLFSTTQRRGDGFIDLDAAYAKNQTQFTNPTGRSIDILRASMNDHFWYGMLSNAKFMISPELTLSAGIDLRYYEGNHYRTVHDLIGGGYYETPLETNARTEEKAPLQVGDKMAYDNTGFVNWVGTFGLLEYSKNQWSAFANISGARVGYSLEDYMKAKVVNLADTSFFVSYGEEVNHNGQTYNLESPEAQNQRVDWVYQNSFTIKTGASYQINEQHNVFFNAGYLSRPMRYTNVIRDNRFVLDAPPTTFLNVENELVTALELGYKFGSRNFSLNFNGYWTNWLNKPLDSAPTVPLIPNDPESDRIPVNVSGIAALHKGIELDFVYRITDKLEAQGLISLGDWIWNSSGIVDLPNDTTSYEFDPTGVHVGDAAQTQLGLMIRYEPIKRLFFKVRTVYFAKNFSDFNPETLKGENARMESWQLPNYFIANFHTGYGFKVQKTDVRLNLNVLNLFDSLYISDGRNNDSFNNPSFNNFDAASASVFFGQGRRWNISMQIRL